MKKKSGGKKKKEKKKKEEEEGKNRRSNACLGKTKAKLAEKLDCSDRWWSKRARELRRFPPSFVTAAAKPM